MICLECGSEMKLSTAPLTESYKGEDTTVSGLEYFVCQECGEVVMSADMVDIQSREMAAEYERRHGIPEK